MLYIVSDVSGYLIRRQNRPDILSAGEEVTILENEPFMSNRRFKKGGQLAKSPFLAKSLCMF